MKWNKKKVMFVCYKEMKGKELMFDSVEWNGKMIFSSVK